MTKVLLVDDSKFSCRRAEEMLLSLDPSLEISAVNLPSEAQQLVFEQGRKFDLAILDFNMPEMNGLELAASLQSHLSYGRIVILTATSAFATHSQSIPEGMHLIQKPISPEKLKAALSFAAKESA